MSGYTPIPNGILDAMADMTHAEFKALMAVYRLIVGYEEHRGRGRRRISLTQLERLTGLSRQGVITATDALIERGYVTKVRTAGRNEWVVNSVDQLDAQVVNSVDQHDDELVNSVDQTSQLSRPVLVNSVDQTSQLSGLHINKTTKQNREKKEFLKKAPLPPDPPAFPFEPVPEPVDRKKRERGDTTPAAERVEAIAAVCGLDLDVPDNQRAAEKAAAQLAKYAADYIRRRYAFGPPGPPGAQGDDWLWAQDDWRGRQGQLPTVRDVITTIGYTRQTGAGPPAAERPLTPMEQQVVEYAALKQQFLDTGGSRHK